MILILVIALIIFGVGKLPQIGENLGKAIRNFKSATEKEKTDVTAKKPEEISQEPKQLEGESRRAFCILRRFIVFRNGI